jgi:hypothetical protein
VGDEGMKLCSPSKDQIRESFQIVRRKWLTVLPCGIFDIVTRLFAFRNAAVSAV